MKTSTILTTTCSFLGLAMTASAFRDPIPRQGADCCYGFGGQTDMVIPTKGSGLFMSEGKWCHVDVSVDQRFPDDCSKATFSNLGGYCERSPGSETFPSVPC